MKKTFVFDLDGTLLNSEKKVSRENREALNRIHAEGHDIVFATARPPMYTTPLIADVTVPYRSIYLNGALFESRQEIHRSIERSLFHEIIEFLEQHDPDAEISMQEKDRWVTHCPFDFKDHFRVDTSPELLSREEMLNLNCTKILIINFTKEKELQERFGNRANVLLTDSGTLIQIMSIDASKESALALLCEDLGKDPENLICFGDDVNDLGMFQFCGTSVAMGNAIEELKEIASHTTDTNDNHGVAQFVNVFLNN